MRRERERNEQGPGVSDEGGRVKKNEYYEKLKDPRWQKKRLEVFERDNFTCRGCGDKESMLTVHHCFYDNSLEPWEYPTSSLVTLCDKCHEGERVCRADGERLLIKILRRGGYLCKDIDDIIKQYYKPEKKGKKRG